MQQFRQAVTPPAEQRNERSVRHALSRMYECDKDDTARIADIISRLWKIPQDIRNGLASIDSLDPTAFNPTIKEFEGLLLELSLGNDALSLKNRASSGLENQLEMISAFLILHHPEALPSDDKIEELLHSLSEIASEIKEADLGKEFTDYFLHRLDELHYALNHYDTLGPDEVIRRVNEVFGGLILQSPEIKKSKKTMVVAKKLWSFVQTVALVINLTNGSFDALENYQQVMALDESVIADDSKPKH